MVVLAVLICLPVGGFTTLPKHVLQLQNQRGDRETCHSQKWLPWGVCKRRSISYLGAFITVDCKSSITNRGSDTDFGFWGAEKIKIVVGNIDLTVERLEQSTATSAHSTQLENALRMSFI